MILHLDRTAGVICGGGVCAWLNADTDPLAGWCRQAVVEGYELHGRTLEMWDRGCELGYGKRRAEPLLCLTVADAHAYMCPAPKPKKGRKA